ncbi:hypothetical protein [Paenibacillus tianjinensis]|uniref:DUF2726 domain-containing protein n=1 Tax=Paenibacillus tianjinensis TaxID=2810347 RepID=A0ABX7L5I6_9BACL|nr:hypothetical protein [Paenibacillus tianjinensis]QSF43347.1 hypothetical protein JRJ22_18960 [Paenibacillus tianjinensis]
MNIYNMNNKKKTTQEISEEINNLSFGEYELVGEYVNKKIKVNILHKKCGNEFSMQINNFRIGQRCPPCSRKTVTAKQTKSHDQFVKEVEILRPKSFIIMSLYQGSKQKIKVRHIRCGREFLIWPSRLLQSRGLCCEYCSRNDRKIGLEKFCEIVKEMRNNEYEVIGEYINSSTKVLIKHKPCGYVYKITPSHFVHSGSECIKCNKLIPLTEEDVVNRFVELKLKDYKLGDINLQKKKIVVTHLCCGYTWNPNYYNFFSLRSNCPKCFGNYKRTHAEFIEEVYQLVGDEYEVLGKFINLKTKICIKHHKCGMTNDYTPRDFLQRSVRCKECFYNGQSKKEEEIARYLRNENIKFIRQYRFSDCVNLRELPFDFAIFNRDENLLFLIEYNGEQHYKPVDLFGGINKLLKQQENDEIKIKYCNDKHINLLIIHYKDFKKYRELIEAELNKYY